MDLVEISPLAKPPVCKIMDYGKFKYDQKKKAAESRRRQTVVHIKEIKLRPKTEEHDYEFKLRNIRRFLEQGDKVRVTMVFRGREMAHRELGQRILDRVVKDAGEIGIVEQAPRMEGRQLFMLMQSNPKWRARQQAAAAKAAAARPATSAPAPAAAPFARSAAMPAEAAAAPTQAAPAKI